jgi:hypothetical protein
MPSQVMNNTRRQCRFDFDPPVRPYFFDFIQHPGPAVHHMQRAPSESGTPLSAGGARDRRDDRHLRAGQRSAKLLPALGCPAFHHLDALARNRAARLAASPLPENLKALECPAASQLLRINVLFRVASSTSMQFVELLV